MNAERVKEIRERVERRCSWYEAEIEVIGNDHDKEWLGKDLSIERDLLALLDDKEAQLKAGGGGTFGRADTESSASAAPSPGPSAEDFAAAIETLEDELEKHKGTVCVNWVTKMNAAIAVLKHPVPSGSSTSPTDEPYNGPLSGRGVITDDGRLEMVEVLDELCTVCSQCRFREACDERFAKEKKPCAVDRIVGSIRALIQSPPKVSVTREWIAEKFLPHRYGGDGYVIEAIAVMLRSLGITVSEAGDSDRPEKGKEGK